MCADGGSPSWRWKRRSRSRQYSDQVWFEVPFSPMTASHDRRDHRAVAHEKDNPKAALKSHPRRQRRVRDPYVLVSSDRGQWARRIEDPACNQARLPALRPMSSRTLWHAPVRAR